MSMSDQKNLTNYEKEEIKPFQGHVYYDGHKCKNKIAVNDLKYCKDINGGYVCHSSDHIYYRYELIRGIGKGAFGKVYLVFDHKEKKHKALKIIRSERRFYQQARMEAAILKTLNKNKARNVVKMEDMFLFRDHPCFVFEYYDSENFFYELKTNGFKGMDIKIVQKVAYQLLEALKDFHSLCIVHCDLKPENLIFKDANKQKIKVLDFGSSCYVHSKLHNYIQSRYYRSPEVILMLGYNTKIDIWSFGAIIFELLIAKPIFPGESEHEVLNYMLYVLGKPSNEYLESSPRFTDFFDPDYNLKRKSLKVERKAKLLEHRLADHDPSLLKMLRKCFVWDQKLRATAEDLLEEEFFKKDLN